MDYDTQERNNNGVELNVFAFLRVLAKKIWIIVVLAIISEQQVREYPLSSVRIPTQQMFHSLLIPSTAMPKESTIPTSLPP